MWKEEGGLFSVPLKGIVVFVSWQPSLVPNQPIHTFWLETEVWREGGTLSTIQNPLFFIVDAFAQDSGPLSYFQSCPYHDQPDNDHQNPPPPPPPPQRPPHHPAHHPAHHHRHGRTTRMVASCDWSSSPTRLPFRAHMLGAASITQCTLHKCSAHM